MAGKILTGTASWTDPGFIGRWYPRTLPASRNNNKGDCAPRAAAAFQQLLQKRSPQAAPDPERELAYA